MVHNADRVKLIQDRRNEFRSYDAYGNLNEIKDGKGNLKARYVFRPDGQIESILRPTSDTAAELQTYKHFYNQDGEQVFEIYKKEIAWEVGK